MKRSCPCCGEIVEPEEDLRLPEGFCFGDLFTYSFTRMNGNDIYRCPECEHVWFMDAIINVGNVVSEN